LFGCDGLNFWSERVFRNFEKRQETSTKRSLAGKKGAEAKKHKQANAKQMLASAKQN
jgi:hypothetical protein